MDNERVIKFAKDRNPNLSKGMLIAGIILLLSKKTLEFTPADIEEIEIDSSFLVNSTPYHRLMIRKTDDTTVAVSPLIANRKHCKLVANSLLVDVSK